MQYLEELYPIWKQRTKGKPPIQLPPVKDRASWRIFCFGKAGTPSVSTPSSEDQETKESLEEITEEGEIDEGQEGSESPESMEQTESMKIETVQSTEGHLPTLDIILQLDHVGVPLQCLTLCAGWSVACFEASH